MGEFFETVFSLDNRLFRTLKNLIFPGRLTNFYLTGKQKPYFHPLRLFFFSGVLMVATYSFYTAQQIGDSMDQDRAKERNKAFKHKFGEKLKDRIDSLQLSFPDEEVAMATDSLLGLMGYSKSKKKSNNSFNIAFLEHKGGLNFSMREVRINNDDRRLLTPNELADKAEIKGTLNRFLFKQVVRLSQLGLDGITTLMGQIIWGLLLLVPLSAAWLKLLYIRRKKKYVEHFIFTLHTHAFIFITQFFAALELILLGTPWLLSLSGLATIVYFLMALKRVYKQSWGKTLVKAILLSMGYFSLIPVVIGFTAILAILVF